MKRRRVTNGANFGEKPLRSISGVRFDESGTTSQKGRSAGLFLCFWNSPQRYKIPIEFLLHFHFRIDVKQIEHFHFFNNIIFIIF